MPVCVWQGSLQSPSKALTPSEQLQRTGRDRDPYWRRIAETHALILPLPEPPMAAMAPGRFVNAAELLAGDTMSVFTDRIGHNTEASLPRMVDAFWPVLAATG